MCWKGVCLHCMLPFCCFESCFDDYKMTKYKYSFLNQSLTKCKMLSKRKIFDRNRVCFEVLLVSMGEEFQLFMCLNLGWWTGSCFSGNREIIFRPACYFLCVSTFPCSKHNIFFHLYCLLSANTLVWFFVI